MLRRRENRAFGAVLSSNRCFLIVKIAKIFGVVLYKNAGILAPPMVDYRLDLRLPWPTPRTARKWHEFHDFTPSLNALLNTFYALHEIVGGVYYRLYYASKP